jgi:ADP-ribose pyrophosphatase YjhB (NUDIX family)
MTDTRPLFTLGAFAIIFDEEGRVLLCHRRDMDAWNLPGGGVEALEMPDECVMREVFEETGLEVQVERMVGVYGKQERNEIVFAFLCRVTGGALRETDESDDSRYFDPTSLPANLLNKHKDRILDALGMRTGEAQPVLRRQITTREQGRRLATSRAENG